MTTLTGTSVKWLPPQKIILLISTCVLKIKKGERLNGGNRKTSTKIFMNNMLVIKSCTKSIDVWCNVRYDKNKRL